jgi:signal peptidase I
MVREVIETLLLALLIFVAVRAVVLNFRVDGHSMDNSLDHNEMLLVNRNAYFSFDQDKWFGWIPGVDTDDGAVSYPFGTPERGDIVVLNPPIEGEDKPYIKRVIGIPGDTIAIHDDGVYVNGTRLDEPYIDGRPTRCIPESQVCGPLEVPADAVFVMGDNRTNSSDSRTFGLVPIDNIIGKAWITYWPTDDIGIVPHKDYPELEEQ